LRTSITFTLVSCQSVEKMKMIRRWMVDVMREEFSDARVPMEVE